MSKLPNTAEAAARNRPSRTESFPFQGVFASGFGRRQAVALTALPLAAMLILLALFLFPPLRVSAEDPGTTVSDSDALASAIADPAVSRISLLPGSEYRLGQTVSVERTLTMTGSGSAVIFGDGQGLTVAPGGALSCSGITFGSPNGSCFTVSGTLSLGKGVTLSGQTGVTLKKGASLTSGKETVVVASELGALIGADCAGGSIRIFDFFASQSAGATDMLRIAQSGGQLIFGGSVELFAKDGCGIICAPGGACPSLSLENGASLNVSAQKAEGSKGQPCPGAAIDISAGAFIAGSEAKLFLTGSSACVSAGSITLGSKASVAASCSPADASERSRAALSTTGKLICEGGVTISIGQSGGSSGNGIYAAGGAQFGDGCSLICRSSASGHSVLSSDGSVSFGSKCTVTAKTSQNGIYAASLELGAGCTLTVSDVSQDGIHLTGSGAVIGDNATIDISAARCALYSKGGVSIGAGSAVLLTAEGNAPAVFLDLADPTKGGLKIVGAKLSVKGAVTGGTVKNSTLYVIGSVSVSGGGELSVINDGDFGMIVERGNLSAEEASRIYCAGKVGILVASGSISAVSGSGIAVEGRLDSAIRVQNGSVNIGLNARLDAQGARFGVEINGSGSLYLNEAAFFDIRSTTDRAVFIENGTLVVSQAERISAWRRAEDANNPPLWWQTVSAEGKHSWELTQNGANDNWLFADYTALLPDIRQNYAYGQADSASGFSWYNSEWRPDDYSRLGQHKARPVGRTNSFNIPAGSSFSWMLFGESYDDNIRFELKDSRAEGDFDLSEDGTFTYKALDYSRGTQSFEFIVTNGDGVSSLPVTINILVTASKPPVAHSATFRTEQNAKLHEQLNILDFDGSIASAKVTQQPEHGAVVLSSDGQFAYEPEEDYIGLDSFTFVAVDNLGDESNVGYVTVAVGMTDGVIACNSTGIAESSTDIAFRLCVLPVKEKPAISYEITVQPVYGTLAFDGLDPELVIYKPYKDFSGCDSFRYIGVLPDGTKTNEAIVTITTLPSRRPIAQPLECYCMKNQSCEGRLIAGDLDGAIVAYTLLEKPSNGIVSINSQTGEFIFTAENGFTGTAVFTFTATDGDGLISDPAPVSVHVTSLIDNLRATGRLGAAVFILCLVLFGVAAIVAVLIVSVRRRRDEAGGYNDRSPRYGFDGSDDDDYDEYDDYDD